MLFLCKPPVSSWTRTVSHPVSSTSCPMPQEIVPVGIYLHCYKLTIYPSLCQTFCLLLHIHGTSSTCSSARCFSCCLFPLPPPWIQWAGSRCTESPGKWGSPTQRIRSVIFVAGVMWKIAADSGGRRWDWRWEGGFQSSRFRRELGDAVPDLYRI